MPTKQERQERMNAFTGWSNDPMIQSYQRSNWNIFVQTGEWDSTTQKTNNKLAQERRSALNPSYDPNANKSGARNKAEADKIILPTEQFVSTNFIDGLINGAKENPGDTANGAIKMGLIGVMVLFVFSLLGRR
jgi:hypothetical protein